MLPDSPTRETRPLPVSGIHPAKLREGFIVSGWAIHSATENLWRLSLLNSLGHSPSVSGSLDYREASVRCRVYVHARGQSFTDVQIIENKQNGFARGFPVGGKGQGISRTLLPCVTEAQRAQPFTYD